jgi:chromosome segregation ATPase
MSKEDITAFIKLYVSEFGAYSESCKEYYKKAEEKLEIAKKNEEDLKGLQAYMEKVQGQLQALNENNDKSITFSNELQNCVRELSEEVKSCKELNERLEKELEEKKLKVDKLEEEMKKKNELIEQYEKRFDELEEGAQNSAQKMNSSEEKVLKLEKLVEKQKKELEDLMRDNESIALKKVSNTNEFAQERLELKKAITVAERTISHLIKEKNCLELKYGLLQRKLDKTSIKYLSKETQTDTGSAKTNDINLSNGEAGRLNKRLVQKEEELKTAKEFAHSLSEEFAGVQQKLQRMQEQKTMSEKQLEEVQKILKRIEGEKGILMKENSDLKRRREQANSEITKLTQKITRKSSKVRAGSKTASQAVILSLFSRYLDPMI